VAQQRCDLGAAVRHVQRGHHRAQAADGEEGDDELGRVGQLHRHHVAARHARAPQPFGETQDSFLEFFPGNDLAGDQRGRIGLCF
jgi:hypothetical protein